MLIRLLSLFAAPFLLVAAAPPQSEGLQGEWRNTNNTVHLRLAPCGGALCGTVTWAAAKQRADARKGSGKEMVGSVLLRNLQASGNATWRGKVFIPDANTNATATVTQLSPVLLLVSGCSFMGMICRTQHWHRID